MQGKSEMQPTGSCTRGTAFPRYHQEGGWGVCRSAWVTVLVQTGWKEVVEVGQFLFPLWSTCQGLLLWVRWEEIRLDVTEGREALTVTVILRGGAKLAIADRFLSTLRDCPRVETTGGVHKGWMWWLEGSRCLQVAQSQGTASVCQVIPTAPTLPAAHPMPTRNVFLLSLLWKE